MLKVINVQEKTQNRKEGQCGGGEDKVLRKASLRSWQLSRGSSYEAKREVRDADCAVGRSSQYRGGKVKDSML